MHDYLRGTRTEETVQSSWEPAAYTMRENWDQLRHAHPPTAPALERAASLVVIEESYPPEAARTQASRCLRCNVNTVFDTDICVACTGCVDVCPEDLIRLTAVADICKDEQGRDWVAGLMGVPPDEIARLDKSQLDALGGVMLKDELTCIRCGLCAARCPSHAITMQRFNFRRQCVTLPGRHPRLNHGSVPATVGQG
jgi:ferredoxin